MTTHGKLTDFDPSVESWTTYAERLLHYLAANETPAAKQKSILLTAMGAKTYSLTKSLCQPSSIDSKSYDDIVNLLKNHFCPKPSEIVQRFKFNKLSFIMSSSCNPHICYFSQQILTNLFFFNWVETYLVQYTLYLFIFTYPCQVLFFDCSITFPHSFIISEFTVHRWLYTNKQIIYHIFYSKVHHDSPNLSTCLKVFVVHLSLRCSLYVVYLPSLKELLHMLSIHLIFILSTYHEDFWWHNQQCIVLHSSPSRTIQKQ